MRCQNNVTCSDLYNTVAEKCNSVLQFDKPVCSDDCRQAVIQLHTHPIGSRLRCCDCGWSGGLTVHNQIVQMNRMRPDNPDRLTMRNQTVQRDRMHPNNLMDMTSPPQCHLAKSRIIKQCGMINNCEDCKASGKLTTHCYSVNATCVIVCPGSCAAVFAHCINNTRCNQTRENHLRECQQVISWDRNSTMPMCTDECKRWTNMLENDPIGQFFKCCNCDDRNITRKMQCALFKTNIEELCDVEFDSAEICQYHMKACDFVKDIERKVKRRGNHVSIPATYITLMSL